MGKCPDTEGINCNYVGCCPWGEVCLDDDDDDDDDNEGEYEEVVNRLPGTYPKGTPQPY